MRMNKRHLLGLVAALPLAWLSACGGGGDNGNDAHVRLVNASPGYASLDLYVDDNKEASAVTFGAGSDYTNVSNGEQERVLTAAGSTSELLSQTSDLKSGERYTVVAYGWEGALKSAIMTEEQSEADSGKTKVSAYNLALDAGELDVYLTGEDDALDASTPIVTGVDPQQQSSFTSLTSGTYRLRVTGTGDTDDLRLDVSGVVLSSKNVLTIVLTPGKSGVLVHGVGVVQEGAVTPYLNTKARVRMIAAVDDMAVPKFSPVTVTADDSAASDVILGANVGSVTIKEYMNVNAGSVVLKASVEGTALSNTTVTLEPGSDTTVLVYGKSAADAAVRVISDDNRLPTVTTKYRIRMIHASTLMAAQNLSMTVDSTAVVSDLPFSTASDFDDLIASDSATIDITSPTQGSVATLTEQKLLAKQVYTLLVRDRLNNGVPEIQAQLSPNR